MSSIGFAATVPLNKPVVALLYVNNTTATYSDAENKKMNDNFKKVLAPYKTVPASAYFEYMTDAGINDFTMADKEDILNAFKTKGIDYVICVEIQSITCTDESSFFTNSTTATAVVPVRIIDTKSGKYLFNSKLVESKRDSGAVFSVVSNKSISLDVIDKVIITLNNIITSRIPSTL
jgi:hypothetical protein